MSTPVRPRIGVLGGSFDPVHLGHLIVAQDAREHMALDRVVFMPTAQAPLKDRVPGLPAETRVELLRSALAGEPASEVSTMEVERGGTSYTVDTARALRAIHPTSDLFWIIGEDQAARLHEWREVDALGRLIEFIVVRRPGAGGVESAVPDGLRIHRIAAHGFEISSSEIRRRISLGLPVRHFLPAIVADRLEKEGLYR